MPRSFSGTFTGGRYRAIPAGAFGRYSFQANDHVARPPHDHPCCLLWVVAGSPAIGGDCLLVHIDRWRHFGLRHLDRGPLKAYVAGTMPGYVFADWIEENVRGFPAEALALLREPAEVK